MNPEIPNLEIASSMSDADISTVAISPMHLLWISILILIVSHFGAKYLASVSPRGYWFWFTILNLVIGLFFI